MRNAFVTAQSDVSNQVDLRGVYPEAGGSTVGTRASALTPYTAGGYKDYIGYNTLTGDPGPGTGAYAVGPGPGASGGDAPASGVVGRPLTWWFVLVVLLVALMWTAQRFGSEGDQFKSVKLSLYNVIVISLAAMVGFGLFKAIFGRFQVPGLSDYVQAV